MKAAIAVWVILVVIVVIGWIKNIIALGDVGFDAGVTVEIALRVTGIFLVPIGVIMGYFV